MHWLGSLSCSRKRGDEMVILLFVLGAILGSFLGVVGYRIPKNESFVRGRSKCECCQQPLRFSQMVPIISYFYYKGRCPVCQKNYSFGHVIGETIMGLCLVGLYLVYGTGVELVVYFLFLAGLYVITVSDFIAYLVPDRILIVMVLLLMPLRLYGHSHFASFTESIFGFVVAITICVGIHYGSGGKGMGGGDYKLFLLIGALFGVSIFLSIFFIAILIGIIHGTIVKRTKKESMFPFVPSIFLASYIVILSNNYLFHLYMDRFY